MSTAETVLNTLRAMPRSEVEAVLLRIKAFQQFGVWGEDKPIGDEASPAGKRVFKIVADEMQAAGLATARDRSYFALPNRTSFNDKAERLVAFVKEQHEDRRVQDGILRIGGQLLIRSLQQAADRKGDFVVTTLVVARSVNRIPACLDREFPGYAACNMLHLLIPHL